MKLTPEDLQRVHDKQIANILRKLGDGKTLTKRENDLLAAEKERPDTSAAPNENCQSGSDLNFVRSWDDLAQELNVSRKSLQNWRGREDLRSAQDYPRARSDGRHDIGAWRAFMIAHGLNRADEEVESDEVEGERKTIRDWKEHRERLMCEKLEREIARGDGLLLVATDLEIPIGATLVAVQTKLSQFPQRASRFMVMLRNEADAQNKLQDEIDAILTDLNLASYIDAGIDAIVEEFPFNEECAELYNRVSFAGQDRAALISLIALAVRETLSRIGRATIAGGKTDSQAGFVPDAESIDDKYPATSKSEVQSVKADASESECASEKPPTTPRSQPKSMTPRRKRGAA